MAAVALPLPEEVARVLARWFGRAARDLPWRRRPTPWRVFVAETMLQQTRVAVVLPRYEEFLARFPDPAALAAAGEEEVLARWSGLGYYRRARSLHAAARAMTERHGGEVPADPTALRALPGVGDYTAGAVGSIAFHRPAPLVDGNVERVLARVFDVPGDVKRGAARRRVWELAAAIAAAGPPAAVNQAMMELGALVCLPRAPRCGECPAGELCAARAAGDPESRPLRPAKQPLLDVTLAVAAVLRGEAALLVRAPAGGFLAGTWAPPFAVVPAGADPAAEVVRAAHEAHGIGLAVGPPLGTVRHQITRHRIRAEVYAARLVGAPRDAVFAGPAERSGYGLSSLAAKALRVASAASSESQSGASD